LFSWVEISLHAEFQLPSMPGSSMVGLEASLAPAEAEVGAVADHIDIWNFLLQLNPFQ
jgi:hypothetical protein